MINLDINCTINIPSKNNIKLDKDEYILCEYKEKHIKNFGSRQVKRIFSYQF